MQLFKKFIARFFLLLFINTYCEHALTMCLVFLILVYVQYKVSQLFFYRYRCRGTNGFGSAEYTYQISFRGENAAQEGILARAFKGTVLREKGLRETMDRKPDT